LNPVDRHHDNKHECDAEHRSCGASSDPPQSKAPIGIGLETLVVCGTDQIGNGPNPEHEQPPDTFRSYGSVGEVSKRLAEEILKLHQEGLRIGA
jgi:hypothetical protein